MVIHLGLPRKKIKDKEDKNKYPYISLAVTRDKYNNEMGVVEDSYFPESLVSDT